MPLSADQNNVVIAKRNNYLVSAGAGSGKTTVLTERVIHLLRDEKYKLSEMIILTFTDLAAKEMKSRIIEALDKENSEDLKEELKHINEADIKTFDSFCHDFVTKYSCYSRIGNSFNIGDKALFTMKMTEILKDILKDYYIDNYEMMCSFIVYNNLDSENLIINYFINLYDNLKTYLGYKEILSNYESIYLNDKKLNEVKTEIINLIKNKLSVLVNFRFDFEDEKTFDNYKEIISRIKVIYELNSFDEIYHNIMTFTIPNGKYSKLSETDQVNAKNLQELIKDIIKSIQSILPESLDKLEEDFYECSRIIPFIRDVIFKLDDKLTEFKEYHKVYGFDDIEKETIRILEENENVRNDYKNKIKEILIDEYQDTNDIGNRIVELIENKNVVVVGDIKQSIYRFRHANPNIFLNLLNKYSKKEDGEILEIKDNYRSRYEEVLDFSNNLFENIKNTRNVEMDYLDQKLKKGNYDYDQFNHLENKPKIIKFYTQVKDEDGNKIEMPSEYELVAYDIYMKLKSNLTVLDKKSRKERPITPGDFLILNPTNTHNNDMAKALKKYGIATKVFAGKSFLRTFEIVFIKNMLKLLALFDSANTENEDFMKSLITILRSFVFKASGDDILKLKYIADKENNLDALKKCYPSFYDELREFLNTFHKKNAYYMIKEIIDKYDVYKKLNTLSNYEEREIKLMKIQGIIKNLSSSMLSLNEIVEYFNYLNLLDIDMDIKQNDLTQSDYVSVMTIHKSKGLEKPICYITGLSGDIKKGSLNFSLKYGLYFKNSSSIMNSINLIEEKYELMREKLRLLYVAITRARESLTFTFNAKELNTTSVFDECKTYQQLLLLNNDLSKYYKDIEIEDVSINDNKTMFTANNLVVFDELEKKEKILVKKRRASHTLYTIDGEIQKFLSLGTLVHSFFEKVNFINDIDSEIIKYNIDPKYNKYLKNFRNKDIFNGSLIKEYHELEFYVDNTNGIMDYVLEKENEYIIVDFKLKNIDDPLYIKQLDTYKNYLSMRVNKPIKTYLYSILNDELKEI